MKPDELNEKDSFGIKKETELPEDTDYRGIAGKHSLNSKINEDSAIEKPASEAAADSNLETPLTRGI